MIQRSGNLIVLSGPSGVGKSTLVGRVRKLMPELEFSVSCTTRAPRPGEEDGREYYFITEEEFLRRKEAGEFLESAGVFAHHYGTLKSEVTRRLQQGKQLLLDIDVQGARQIRSAAEQDPFLARAAQFVLIAPPGTAVLEQRLRGRASESEEQLQLRLAGALRELRSFPLYDYIVINDDLETAVRELHALFLALKLRTALIKGEPF